MEKKSDGRAKYIFQWTDNLVTQLNKSIKEALNKHQNLIKFIVCLPFDLPDSRCSGGKSARRKWDAWCTKWQNHAQQQNPNLTITLWDKHEITTRLLRNDVTYSGQLMYWFDHEAMTQDWFKQQFDKALKSLGSRYSPNTDVKLPIRQHFLAFARNTELQKEIDDWYSSIIERGNHACETITSIELAGNNTISEPLAQVTQILASSLP